MRVRTCSCVVGVVVFGLAGSAVAQSPQDLINQQSSRWGATQRYLQEQESLQRQALREQQQLQQLRELQRQVEQLQRDTRSWQSPHLTPPRRFPVFPNWKSDAADTLDGGSRS